MPNYLDETGLQHLLTQLKSKVYNKTEVDNLIAPAMIMRGTLGTGGTITALPTASAGTVGDMYKVIVAGTYNSQVAKVGDVFVCYTTNNETYQWAYIPAGDDIEDTWRSVQVNGMEKLGTGLTTGALNFANGDNTTVSYDAGIKIDVDLSNVAASTHNHDSTYLKLSGGTMTNQAIISWANSGSWTYADGKTTNTGPIGALGGLSWSGQSDSVTIRANEVDNDQLDLQIVFKDDDSNGLSIMNKDSVETARISALGAITATSFKITNGSDDCILLADGTTTPTSTFSADFNFIYGGDAKTWPNDEDES